MEIRKPKTVFPARVLNEKTKLFFPHVFLRVSKFYFRIWNLQCRKMSTQKGWKEVEYVSKKKPQVNLRDAPEYKRFMAMRLEHERILPMSWTSLENQILMRLLLRQQACNKKDNYTFLKGWHIKEIDDEIEMHNLWLKRDFFAVYVDLIICEERIALFQDLGENEAARDLHFRKHNRAPSE